MAADFWYNLNCAINPCTGFWDQGSSNLKKTIKVFYFGFARSKVYLFLLRIPEKTSQSWFHCRHKIRSPINWVLVDLKDWVGQISLMATIVTQINFHSSPSNRTLVPQKSGTLSENLKLLKWAFTSNSLCMKSDNFLHKNVQHYNNSATNNLLNLLKVFKFSILQRSIFLEKSKCLVM